MIEYHSIQNILDLCKEQDKKIWEVVLQADMDESCLLYTSPSPRDCS